MSSLDAATIADLDAPVRNLVVALNDIIGVDTMSSCGGHEHRTYEWQAPADHFYLSFTVSRDYLGFLALDGIAGAIADLYIDECSLTAWSGGSEDKVAFQIDGKPGSSADELAQAIKGVGA